MVSCVNAPKGGEGLFSASMVFKQGESPACRKSLKTRFSARTRGGQKETKKKKAAPRPRSGGGGGGAFAFSGKTDAERFMLESGRGKPLSKQNKSRRHPA